MHSAESRVNVLEGRVEQNGEVELYLTANSNQLTRMLFVFNGTIILLLYWDIVKYFIVVLVSSENCIFFKKKSKIFVVCLIRTKN